MVVDRWQCLDKKCFKKWCTKRAFLLQPAGCLKHFSTWNAMCKNHKTVSLAGGFVTALLLCIRFHHCHDIPCWISMWSLEICCLQQEWHWSFQLLVPTRSQYQFNANHITSFELQRFIGWPVWTHSYALWANTVPILHTSSISTLFLHVSTWS